MNNRWDIINHLINICNGSKYLEIGVNDGTNFDQIKCKYKLAIDPDFNSKASIFETSDVFFTHNDDKFDVIFIDGLHHNQQVYLDIYNSLRSLNDNGYIVCHDLLPPSEEYQIVPPIQSLWTGDCWKAWVKIRSENADLLMRTVDSDFGCGIIKNGKQDIINTSRLELNWNNFNIHKQEWMNIISIKDFYKIYK